jgi:hypothetical protein
MVFYLVIGQYYALRVRHQLDNSGTCQLLCLTMVLDRCITTGGHMCPFNV